MERTIHWIINLSVLGGSSTYRELAERLHEDYRNCSETHRPTKIMIHTRGIGAAFADYMGKYGLPIEVV